MNYLKDKKAYLSGPIQYDTSNINWRIDPMNVLRTKFDIDIFDPFSDPKQQWVEVLKKAREQKDFETMAKIAKRFVRKDLAVVDRSDFVIAYLPDKVPTVGTHHEVINSNNLKKPTLLVTNMNDISYIPIWYFGFIPIEFMFPSWDSLYEYLNEINNGKYRENDRWSYVFGDV